MSSKIALRHAVNVFTHDLCKRSPLIARMQDRVDERMRSIEGGGHKAGIIKVLPYIVVITYAVMLDHLPRVALRVLTECWNRLSEWGGRRSSRIQRVSRPPGIALHRLALTVFGKIACERIFEPEIADLQFQYFDALARGRRFEARFAAARGYYAFWRAVLHHVGLVAILKAAVEIRKAFKGA